MSPLTNTRRPDNLALIFQEVFTAIERLRSKRDVADAQGFRFKAHDALRQANSQALAAGYPANDVKYAEFATVAFLDESVLNSHNPAFADWLRKPMQEELYGNQLAGEIFFHNLQKLLALNDSADLADLLEVHYLCLLLGFGGRYSANRGALSQIMDMTATKIRRIRGGFGPLSPSWELPAERAVSRTDPWVRKLGWLAMACVILMALLFVGYKLTLDSGVSDVRSIATQRLN